MGWRRKGYGGRNFYLEDSEFFIFFGLCFKLSLIEGVVWRIFGSCFVFEL